MPSNQLAVLRQRLTRHLPCGTPQYNGAIVVAKTLDPLGNPLASMGPGSATFNTNGGGNGGVNYSTGCLTQATTLSTFHVVAIRELMN